MGQAEIIFPATDIQPIVLPNGLTLLIKEDHSAPVVSIQAWVGTGSIHEGEWLGSGVSHFLEHMLFKGTKKRTPQQITQEIQDEGGYVNAYTSFDRTVYWVDVPTLGAHRVIDVLSDIVMNSILDKEEFVREQEVIRREYAMVQDDPDRVNSQDLFTLAYREHPYKYPIIGQLDLFNQLTREDLWKYYKSRYVPNNITFVIVGDVKADEVHAQIEKLFAEYPAHTLAPVYIPHEPTQGGQRVWNLKFPTELSRISGSWHIPEITHPDIPALDVLATVFGTGHSSRLHRHVRDELKLVHSVYSFIYTPAQTGTIGFEALADYPKRAEAERAILKVLAQIQSDGILPSELLKAQKTILSHQLDSLVTMRGQANDYGINWLLTGNLNFSRDYLLAIQRVTCEDVQRVANRYLKPELLSLATLDPIEDSAEAIRKEEKPPTEPEETQMFHLKNGLRVLIREDHRLPLVDIEAIFCAGLLTETPANNGITKLFSRTLLKGTKHRTANEIAEAIEAVGGSMDTATGNNSVSVAFEVMEPDLSLALDILSDVLLHTNYPEDVIEREKQAQCASLKNEEDHITTVASRVTKEHLFKSHPYALRPNGSPDSVARLTRQDLLNYHQQFLVGSNGVLAIFGSVEPQAVLAQLETKLKDLPSGTPATYLKHAPLSAPLIQTEQVEKILDKEQAVLMVGYRGTTVTNPDRFALDIIDEACSDMGSRFFTRIREELGLAYFIGSTNQPGLSPGFFNFYVGTDPKKLELVQTVFLEEIAHLANNGLTADELLRAKKKLIGKQAISNQSNGNLGFLSAIDELYGLGFLHYKDLIADLEKITQEDVKRVAAHYFKDQFPVITTVGPSKASEKYYAEAQFDEAEEDEE